MNQLMRSCMRLSSHNLNDFVQLIVFNLLSVSNFTEADSKSEAF